jgi:hypothetical protein
VSREVIEDDVNLLAGWMGRNDFAKKAKEVGAGVPFGCLAGYFAGLYIQRGMRESVP